MPIYDFLFNFYGHFLSISICYFHPRRLRTVRRSLTKESLLTLVHAFITNRVDHFNGVLYGSNGYLLDRLQSVLNSAARLIWGILDPIPTWLLKEMAVEISPFITALFNRSILEGNFPLAFRTAEITPILKKNSLDSSIITNYRPISNLSYLRSRCSSSIIWMETTSFPNINQRIEPAIQRNPRY